MPQKAHASTKTKKKSYLKLTLKKMSRKQTYSTQESDRVFLIYSTSGV